MSDFHKLTIKNIVKEANNAVSISFTIPENLKQEFNFTAGQYITIKKELNGKELRRAYSLCSSPNEDVFSIAVKAVDNGQFSVYATEKLQVGDSLEVSKPEGRFIIEPKAEKNYIGFAAGSGITPVFSMIKSVLSGDTNASFTLVYGNKTIKDTIFYEELVNLQNEFSTKLKLHFVFSQEKTENSYQGRIDKQLTQEIIKNTSFDEAFLCGPEAMINTVSETLQKNGFDKDSIKFELFTASVKSDESISAAKGTTEVKILLDGEEFDFSMQQTDTILAASLRHKIDAPYSCQGGVCSSCIAKVTEGNAIMSKNQILSNEELEEGFVLTCMAHPTTAKIVVDYDDV